jgi:hypothetical protein
LPLFSNPQDTKSGRVDRETALVSCTIAAQSSSSSGPKERRKRREAGETGSGRATEILLLEEISKSLGNLIASGASPTHQSVQKEVFSPFST